MGMIRIDMLMPENCSECRFKTKREFCKAMPDNFCGCTNDKGRPEWCPLKEIHDDHESGEVGMNSTEKAIIDLIVAKRILCNLQMLTPEMCVRIGQAITSAIALLKEQEAVVRCKDCKHLFDGEHTKNCCDVLMEKAGWLKEISVSQDWFCANGERR